MKDLNTCFFCKKKTKECSILKKTYCKKEDKQCSFWLNKNEYEWSTTYKGGKYPIKKQGGEQ